MEHKIGKIFEYDGEWYQCVKGIKCYECAFAKKHCSVNPLFEAIGSCSKYYRKDATSVIFKKLEKIGEPYEHYEKFYQCYKLPMETEIRLLPNNCNPIGKDNLVEIEIKQKEDMEENYKTEDTLLTRLVGRYVNNLIDYETFEKAVKELYSDKEESKSVLKEFDLEAVKAGKPVCTRDGRKARIICFDLKNEEYPIVAAIGNDSSETLLRYTLNGEIVKGAYKANNDLMMLSEKKGGWVNVYKFATVYVVGTLFDNEEDARKDRLNPDYIATIKIEWEE